MTRGGSIVRFDIRMVSVEVSSSEVVSIMGSELSSVIVVLVVGWELVSPVVSGLKIVTTHIKQSLLEIKRL